jgi:hypothetical protein
VIKTNTRKARKVLLARVCKIMIVNAQKIPVAPKIAPDARTVRAPWGRVMGYAMTWLRVTEIATVVAKATVLSDQDLATVLAKATDRSALVTAMATVKAATVRSAPVTVMATVKAATDHLAPEIAPNRIVPAVT